MCIYKVSTILFCFLATMMYLLRDTFRFIDYRLRIIFLSSPEQNFDLRVIEHFSFEAKKKKRKKRNERRSIPSCSNRIYFVQLLLNAATSTSAIIFSSTLSSLSRVSYLFPPPPFSFSSFLLLSHFFPYFLLSS